mmetsp:Transcript_39215/g.121200  ORF Transcript_39215/g.121200 Transcript_39215/m.121200 type:complete len:393 (-) Transcript_39215:343-1521(-)
MICIGMSTLFGRQTRRWWWRCTIAHATMHSSGSGCDGNERPRRAPSSAIAGLPASRVGAERPVLVDHASVGTLLRSVRPCGVSTTLTVRGSAGVAVVAVPTDEAVPRRRRPRPPDAEGAAGATRRSTPSARDAPAGTSRSPSSPTLKPSVAYGTATTGPRPSAVGIGESRAECPTNSGVAAPTSTMATAAGVHGGRSRPLVSSTVVQAAKSASVSDSIETASRMLVTTARHDGADVSHGACSSARATLRWSVPSSRGFTSAMSERFRATRTAGIASKGVGVALTPGVSERRGSSAEGWSRKTESVGSSGEALFTAGNVAESGTMGTSRGPGADCVRRKLVESPRGAKGLAVSAAPAGSGDDVRDCRRDAVGVTAARSRAKSDAPLAFRRARR